MMKFILDFPFCRVHFGHFILGINYGIDLHFNSMGLCIVHCGCFVIDRVFNNLTPPSSLKEGSDLQLFRAGVSPAWEDSFNAKGGTWTYRITSDDTTKKLDTAWFNTVLTMIGDQFDDADDICGVVVSKRSQTNRLGLWIKHADDRDAVKRIGKQLKEMNRIKSRIRFLVKCPLFVPLFLANRLKHFDF